MGCYGVVVSIKFPAKVIEELDKLIEQGYFINRSEAIRTLVIMGLNPRQKWAPKLTEADITYMLLKARPQKIHEVHMYLHWLLGIKPNSDVLRDAVLREALKGFTKTQLRRIHRNLHHKFLGTNVIVIRNEEKTLKEVMQK